MDRFWTAAELLDVLGDWAGRPGPWYRRLTEALRAAVDAGDLGAGDRLPSERDLARALGVSRATVVSAYDQLRGLSIVDSRSGSGTRVSPGAARARTGRVAGGTATSIVQRLVDGTDRVISLSMASGPGQPLIADELGALVREDLAGLLADSGYHPHGLLRLRQAVADHYTSAGLATDVDQIVVTTGATQAIALATQLYVPRGATVVVESPSWPGCIDSFRAAGARLVGVPLDDEGIQADQLAETLRMHRCDLLYVMPSFHNPTGVLMSAPRRRQVADLAARHDVVVLEDSPDPQPEPLPLAAGSPATVLTVGSMTKAVWGGLRIGWVRAPSEVAVRLARLKTLADLGSPVLDQALTARLLPKLPRLAAEKAAALREHRDLLERALLDRMPGWRWRSPAGGSSLWIELPGVDAQVFAQVALRHGVEVVPGAATDPSGAHDSFIRVTFTFPPQVLETMVERLERAWLEFTC